jgi:hypothetical protein
MVKDSHPTHPIRPQDSFPVANWIEYVDELEAIIKALIRKSDHDSARIEGLKKDVDALTTALASSDKTIIINKRD